jgi:hypothetical protein
VPFTRPASNATMLLNKLSGEGLFDERPSTQMRLGRFVLGFIRRVRHLFVASSVPITYVRIDATSLFAGAVLQGC